MSHSTETTSKGSSHSTDAKRDLPRCTRLHIRLHLNTSYGCSSCSHACENGKKKKKRYGKDKNGEPLGWRTQEGNDRENSDRNVKQAKTHTRENIAPSSIYKRNGTDMFEQEDVL